MAKRNGGIIGPDNVPAGPLGAAGGVWRLEDAFNAQKAGTWPVVLGYQVPNSLRFNPNTDYLSRTPTFEWNFGSPFYSANNYADGNGYGNFSYAVPSGYYALCTANLNTYG